MSYQQQESSQQNQQNQQHQWSAWQQETVVSIEAVTPSPQTFTQLAQQLQSMPGINEIALRRSGATPRIRVEVTRESLPNIMQVLQQVVQPVQQAYSTSSF